MIRRPLKSITPLGSAAVVFCFAAAVRALLAGVPLVISSDGAGYIVWALAYASGEHPLLPTYRTPGYSWFLAGLFRAFGTGPGPVLVAQHLLGALTCAAVAWVAARLARPGWGLALGLVLALDPLPLAFECYALSETLSTALLLGAALLAGFPGRRWWVSAPALGAVLGALALVRPAFQVVVPLFVLAQVLAAPRCGRRAWGAPALALAAAALTVLPWVASNAHRGILALSGSSGTILWIGASEAGLLDERCWAGPPEVLAAYRSLVAPDPRYEPRIHRFLGEARAWDGGPGDAALRAWALASLRAYPLRYAAAGLTALCWQADCYPPWGAVRENKNRWALRRLGEDGRLSGQRAANFQLDYEPVPLDRFVMGPAPPTPARVFRWLAGRYTGAPRAVLLVFAAVASAVAWRTGRRGAALVLLGTLACTAVHAAFLLSPSRYSLPCWVVWYIAPAVVIPALGRVLTRQRAARAPGSAGA